MYSDWIPGKNPSSRLPSFRANRGFGFAIPAVEGMVGNHIPTGTRTPLIPRADQHNRGRISGNRGLTFTCEGRVSGKFWAVLHFVPHYVACPPARYPLEFPSCPFVLVSLWGGGGGLPCLSSDVQRSAPGWKVEFPEVNVE